jgi:hypothetical protein
MDSNSSHGLLGYDALTMEAARTSETVVSCHINTWHHNPDDLNLNLHCCENLKSRLMNSIQENIPLYKQPVHDQQSGTHM